MRQINIISERIIYEHMVVDDLTSSNRVVSLRERNSISTIHQNCPCNNIRERLSHVMSVGNNKSGETEIEILKSKCKKLNPQQKWRFSNRNVKIEPTYK